MKYNTKSKIYPFQLFFWINLIIAMVIFIYLLYLKRVILLNGGSHSLSTNLFDQYAIIISIICIPSALKLYQYISKRYETKDYSIFKKKIRQAFVFRIAIIDLAIIINLIGLYIYESKNMFFMIIICLISLLFCMPNFALNNDREDNIDETKLNE